MKMNINDRIIVRLTPAGEQAWARYYTQPEGILSVSAVPASIRLARTLPDGRVAFQIWQAMATFGADCFNGSNRLPFVKNEIEIENPVD